jgi:NAD(P)-dependent dehydrogenase (short-subunit alcohol dehydrogenase family)
VSRVLVTGGASGLGAALVARFAERGDQVISADLSGPPVAERTTGSASSVVRRRLDVTSEDDWASAVTWVEQQWGGLDVLVNNAGVAGGGRLELTSIEDWRWIIDVNLLGVVRGARAFVPMMKAQGAGRVVNTASLAGLVHPPGMGSYNAVKAAVVAFSETMSHELAPYGVGCTAVCPSYFRTNLMSSMRGQDTALAAQFTKLVETSPISADDIAVAVIDGLDRGLDLVVPDEPARAAYALKLGDREAYDAQMRSIASRAVERDR